MPPTLDHLRSLSPEEVSRQLLAEPEGQWFDRKSNRTDPRRLSRALVAMANADGGMIAIGFHDGKCEGVDGAARAQNDWRQAGLDFTDPPVRFETELLPCINERGEADHVFVLTIPPGRQVHSTADDLVYQRVGDENRRLKYAQRTQLGYDRVDTTFEISPLPDARVDDLDADRVADFARQLNAPDPERLLRARGLIDVEGQVTTAAMLLFGRDPQQFHPGAWLRVIRYDGTERFTGSTQNLAADARCDGPIPRQIRAAVEAIRRLIPQHRRLGDDLRFGMRPIVPDEVTTEAVVNAVAHRAYSLEGDHVRVAIFDDRVEVSSPGRFPGIHRPGDITEIPRYARNPRIARIMAELGFGQELGEGLRRMASRMDSAGLPLPILGGGDSQVEVTLWGLPTQAAELQELSPIAQSLYSWIGQSDGVKTAQLAARAGVSRPTILRYLSQLQELNLIRRVATSPNDPTAYWVRAR